MMNGRTEVEQVWAIIHDVIDQIPFNHVLGLEVESLNCDQPPVNQRVQHPPPVFPHIADPSLVCGNDAAVAAKRAPHLLIFKLFVKQRFHGKITPV